MKLVRLTLAVVAVAAAFVAGTAIVLSGMVPGRVAGVRAPERRPGGRT